MFTKAGAGPQGFAYPVDLDYSCIFDATAATRHAITTPVESADNLWIATFSVWLKRFRNVFNRQVFFSGYTNSSNHTWIGFGASGSFKMVKTDVSATDAEYVTSQKYIDTSTWYHFVMAFDSTQATANDRFKLWVNGVQNTDFSTRDNYYFLLLRRSYVQPNFR
jgi:hypothetical protein